jgi:hypothetical protein
MAMAVEMAVMGVAVLCFLGMYAKMMIDWRMLNPVVPSATPQVAVAVAVTMAVAITVEMAVAVAVGWITTVPVLYNVRIDDRLAQALFRDAAASGSDSGWVAVWQWRWLGGSVAVAGWQCGSVAVWQWLGDSGSGMDYGSVDF